jgi:hypothetical protein
MRNNPKVLYYKDNQASLAEFKTTEKVEKKIILPPLDLPKLFEDSPLVTTGRLKPQSKLTKDDI